MIEIPEDATHYYCGKFYCFIDNIPMVYQPEDKKWCLATVSMEEVKDSLVTNYFLTLCDILDIEVNYPDEVKNIKNSWGIKAND